jgi:hypothetical protein
MYLNLRNGLSAQVTQSICEKLRVIEIGCPCIDYALGQIYLPCESAGSCVELAGLALKLDELLSRSPMDDQDDGARPRFTYVDSTLEASGYDSAKSRDELAALAERIKSELRPGLLDYVRAGGTR